MMDNDLTNIIFLGTVNAGFPSPADEWREQPLNLHDLVVKHEFVNTRPGFELLQSKLAQLAVQARQMLIGLEATSRYGENLYHFLENQGYQLCLLHPRQTHQFTQQRGLRAKTDRLDATTIARVLPNRGSTTRLRASAS
jgi:transposase